jgi:hypothetical protein
MHFFVESFCERLFANPHFHAISRRKGKEIRTCPAHASMLKTNRLTIRKTGTPFHLAFPVRDIEESRQFYGGILGCVQGRIHPGKWVDYSLNGHQIVCHWVGKDYKAPDYYNPVDGECFLFSSMRVYKLTWMYAHIYLNTCTDLYICVYKHMCICIRTCIHTLISKACAH